MAIGARTANPDKLKSEFEFIWPLQTLVGDGFQLEPFEIEKHATIYWDATGPGQSLYRYVSFGPFATKEDFISGLVHKTQSNEDMQLYAIMTTRKPRSDPSTQSDGELRLAGLAGFQDALPLYLSVEIGPVLLVPEFQGIGLAAAVVKLMVQHCLKDVAAGGWGLRRILWMANLENKSSIKLAERVGFKKEGVQRWQMVFRDGAARGKIGNGRPVPPSSDPRDIGRDSIIMSRCWDD